MPRQAPLRKKIEWTELADAGLSTAEIRAQDQGKPDPRTIEKAINQIHGQRRRALAREAALKEGLQEHWHLLLDKLDLLPTREFDWMDFDKSPLFALKAFKLNGQAWSAIRKQTDWKVDLAFESTIEAQLLREHLPTDAFWSLVTTFKRELAEALKARLALATAVISSVENSTKLTVVKEESEPGLVLVGLARLGQWLEAQAIKDETTRIRLKIEDGAVSFQNTLIARPTGSTAESLKAVIEEAIEDLRGKEAWKGLLTAATKITATARTLANESAVLQLSTVLPGECRSCARYSV